MSWLALSTQVSLAVQFLTGLVQIRGLLAARRGSILQGSLFLETFVQVVEGLFYAFFVTAAPSASSMMMWRYIDWLLTTPTMLISLSAYMTHRETRGRGSWVEFWRENGPGLVPVLVFNAIMLLSGYAIRKQWVPAALGWVVGWYAFFMSFALLARRFGWHHSSLRATFGLWSLYGVADWLPDVPANILINGLDIVAKNLFGILLSAEALYARST